MHLLAKGAEAHIYQKENEVIKHRISKSYRLPEIDKSLRQFRTRRESKVLEKLKAIGFPSPSLIETDDKDMKISMSLISGQKLRDIFEQNPEKFGREIGQKIGILHNNNIVHADLTTSNMILNDNSIHLIDFGLSFFSHKTEDKAVDLHLLERAIESKHHSVYKTAIKEVIEGYKETNNDAEEILNRLKQVKLRGRYKQKS